jgi:hypothetical protein
MWKAKQGEVEGKRVRGLGRAAWLGVSVATVLMFAVLPLQAQTGTVRAAADSSAKTLADLPPAILPAISSALGHDDAQYGMHATADGYTAQNAANHLAAHYTSEGVEIRSQNDNWGLEFQGWGYGEHTSNRSKAAVAPVVNANRIEYRRGTLTEWYVNGPLGIEQGFTISKPPAALPDSKHDELDIELGLQGSLSATIQSGRHALALRNQKGVETLRYGPLLVYDASGRELESWIEVQDGSLRLRVNTAGARYPIIVDPWVQTAQLTNSLGAAGDDLGYSVAIDGAGDTIVVGSTSVNVAQGAVYMFVEPTSGGWANTSTFTAELTSSDGVAGDALGRSLGINASGNTVVVGAPLATIGGNVVEGAAYVFVEPANGWASEPTPFGTQTAKLTASDAAAGDEFGWSVGIDETADTIIAGDFNAKIGAHTNQGTAYVFVEPTSGGWVTTSSFSSKLTASDGAQNDAFGLSVGIDESGNTVVVGAIQASRPTLHQGAVYVFVEPTAAGGWTSAPSEKETAELTASDATANSFLGWSVGISANTVVSGAYQTDFGSNLAQGAAYVFVEPTNGWASEPTTTPFGTQTAELTASDGAAKDEFGSAVAISGNTVVVGIGSNTHQDAVYVFVEPTNGWASEPTTTPFGTQTAELTASGGAVVDFLGNSVGISGNTIVAGAPAAKVGSNARQGAAYVFTQAGVGPADVISSTSGSGQTAMVGTAFSAPLVATVVNGSGTGVSDVNVTFTANASAGGASGTFAGGVNTAVTDASGNATSAVFTANGTAGSYTVTATALNVTGTASFSLTNQATVIATTTTINSTTSTSKLGFSFPSNTALVDGPPVTVNFTVQQASGSTTPTGTVVVVDDFGDTCTTSTLNSGKGTCAIPMITQFGTGTTNLKATYTISTNGFLASQPSSGFPESLVEIASPCTNAGTTHSNPTPIQQQTVTTVCLGGNLNVVPSVAWETDCMPREKCSVTVSPETPGAPEYTVTLTSIHTDAGVKGSLPTAPPRGGPWVLTVFEFVALLSILMALQLARQKRTRLQLSCAAGVLCVFLLGGMSSCNGPAGAPPGNYTVDLTITAGQFQLVVPVTVTVPK